MWASRASIAGSCHDSTVGEWRDWSVNFAKVLALSADISAVEVDKIGLASFIDTGCSPYSHNWSDRYYRP